MYCSATFQPTTTVRLLQVSLCFFQPILVNRFQQYIKKAIICDCSIALAHMQLGMINIDPPTIEVATSGPSTQHAKQSPPDFFFSFLLGPDHVYCQSHHPCRGAQRS